MLGQTWFFVLRIQINFFSPYSLVSHIVVTSKKINPTKRQDKREHEDNLEKLCQHASSLTNKEDVNYASSDCQTQLHIL